MSGSTSPSGQSSTNPSCQNSFGTQQGFGQATIAANNKPFAPKPSGSPITACGAQTGGSPFGTASTGAFGQQQSTPTFGITSTGAFGQQQSTPTFGTPSSSPVGSTAAFGTSAGPAFGATPSTFGSGSLFGQKQSFGSSPSQSSPFATAFQQTQPTFGSSTFGASTAPAVGTTTTPTLPATAVAFGTSTSAFGTATTPAFGSTSTSLFGASTTLFGSSTPGFGTSGSIAFGVGTTAPGLGSSSTPSFGTSTNAFSFGSSPSFAQTAVSSASSPFGTTSPFGAQTPAFGSQTASPDFGQAQFGNRAGGTTIKPYAQTPDVDGATSGSQPTAKLDSISAMPEYKDKSHEELRWEDYQRGDKGEPNPSGTPAAAPIFPSSQQNSFTPTGNLFNQSTPITIPTSNPFAPKPGSISASQFNTSFNSTVASSSPFTSSTSTTMFGPIGVSTFSASSSPFLFTNTALFATSSLFPSTTNNSNPFGTLFSLASTQSAPLFQSSPASAQQPLSTPARSSGNLFSTPPGNLFGSGPSLLSTTSAPVQTSKAFSFQPPTQPDSAACKLVAWGSQRRKASRSISQYTTMDLSEWEITCTTFCPGPRKQKGKKRKFPITGRDHFSRDCHQPPKQIQGSSNQNQNKKITHCKSGHVTSTIFEGAPEGAQVMAAVDLSSSPLPSPEKETGNPSLSKDKVVLSKIKTLSREKETLPDAPDETIADALLTLGRTDCGGKESAKGIEQLDVPSGEIESRFDFSKLGPGFEESIETLSSSQLCDLMTSLAMKSIASGKMAYEKVGKEVEELRSGKLKAEAENEKLKQQVAKLKHNNENLTTKVGSLTQLCSRLKSDISELKTEIEKDVECYEQIRNELRMTVEISNAKTIEIDAKNELIAELQKTNANLEKT